MSNETKNISNCIGIALNSIGLVFIILKLAGVINWSWWWVTLPFWIGFAGLFVFATIVMIAIGILKLLEKGLD